MNRFINDVYGQGSVLPNVFKTDTSGTNLATGLFDPNMSMGADINKAIGAGSFGGVNDAMGVPNIDVNAGGNGGLWDNIASLFNGDNIGNTLLGGKDSMGLIGGLGSLLGAFNSYNNSNKQMALLEDAYDFNKSLATNNYENERQNYNDQLRWRAESELLSKGNYSGYDDPRLKRDVAAQVDQQSLKRGLAG